MVRHLYLCHYCGARFETYLSPGHNLKCTHCGSKSPKLLSTDESEED